MVAALNSVFIFVRVLELCLELCRGGRSLPKRSATSGAPSNTLIFFFPCFSFSRTSWRRSSRSSRTACCSASILSSMDGPGAAAASTVSCSGSDAAGGGAAVRDADISHGLVFATFSRPASPHRELRFIQVYLAVKPVGVTTLSGTTVENLSELNSTYRHISGRG